ncbi:diguanylate cyclase [Photobacterium jeanii]|uniref:Diguanylate cyclase n=1 Tax=Photobacterium jeanii TaxID=858640 RepID=A0A178KBB0_9GAMM|nr:extracellular solute-binding protein [Photobacterium jeanii]OAN13972.1 diguanylate cyclase [Photobacterium jeanii]PST87016.1 ABC transporter substrate-binding protein [Photobacterium jeanii]
MKRLSLSAAFGACLLTTSSFAAQLPSDLTWISNANEPLFASPEAQFGGKFRTYIQSFPQTFRVIGPDSNGAFRSWLVDNRPSSVTRHPITNKWIPEIASQWAYGADNKTVYFKINPKATWSDGKPITADDFVFVLTLMRSKDIIAPWYNQFYTEEIADIVKYDDHTYAVVSTKPRNREELMIYSNMQPRPAHFYAVKVDNNNDGIDDKFIRRFNFKPEPSAGPYYVDKIKKGKSITFKHVGQDWWGYSNRYFKHRYNVEQINIKVIRDNDIARKHFEKGDIDTFGLLIPSLWHDKSNGKPYQDGYIHKFWGYNQTPQGAGGLWINTAKPHLNNIEVRKGLANALDFDGLIVKLLRGDYIRQPNGVGVGHGDYTNTTIAAPKFDPELAAQHFAKAGFDKLGTDGIRVNAKGERLSFAVTYGYTQHTARIAYLKEQAKQAGLELTLNLVDGSSAFKYVLEKKHQLSFHQMGTSEIPAYWEYFHSVNANKPQTNNFTNFSTPELDKLIIAYRGEFDLAKKKSLSRQIQQIVTDANVIVPGYMVPYTREGYWRWLKYPKPAMTKLTQFLFTTGTFRDYGTFWIDPVAYKETKAALKKGTQFEPVTVVDDTYKLTGSQ